MSAKTLSPADAAKLCEDGAALIDIRSRDEFARERASKAENRPLDTLDTIDCDSPVIFMCKSGMRTGGNADRLVSCTKSETYILKGGLDAWKAAGLETIADASQPMEIMRQVQITAGMLVLIGVVLGLLINPLWFGLAAFVGTGLTFAGVSGWCGMAHALALMPRNRRAQA